MTRTDIPYGNLKRTYHEPNRLAIMTVLCGATSSLSFAELKTACGLTDGNLNRHLKALSAESAVRVSKETIRSRPCTRITVTELGRRQFVDYLETLETVLQQTAKTLAAQEAFAADQGVLALGR